MNTLVCDTLGLADLKLFGQANLLSAPKNDYLLNSRKGGSSNFNNFSTGINSFQTDSSNLSCEKSKA